MYDTLYVTAPLMGAICAKDDTNKYCLTTLAGNTTAKANSGIANAAQQPLGGSNGLPNAAAFSAANILFLGANPQMDAASLCTTCTKNVMSNYFAFESLSPYVTGLPGSPLLAQQNALYSAIQTTCPADFLSSALGNAGANPNSINGAATFSPAQGVMAVLAVAAGFMTL